MPTVGTAYCEYCKKQVVARKKGCNHVLHAVLSLLTGGFWLIIWLLCVISCDDWYCTQCGRKVRLDSHEPDLRCKKCGSIIDKDADFCSNCGQSTGRVCSKCGTKNSNNSIFCSKCGNKLTTQEEGK